MIQKLKSNLHQALEIKSGKISLIEHVEAVKDLRMKRSQRHLPIDIITIAILGGIYGGNDWVVIAEYGRSKQEWLKTFLRITKRDTESRHIWLCLRQFRGGTNAMSMRNPLKPDAAGVWALSRSYSMGKNGQA